MKPNGCDDEDDDYDILSFSENSVNNGTTTPKNEIEDGNKDEFWSKQKSSDGFHLKPESGSSETIKMDPQQLFEIYKKSQGDRKLKNNGTVANSSIEDNTVTVGANAHERNNTEGNSHSHADKQTIAPNFDSNKSTTQLGANDHEHTNSEAHSEHSHSDSHNEKLCYHSQGFSFLFFIQTIALWIWQFICAHKSIIIGVLLFVFMFYVAFICTIIFAGLSLWQRNDGIMEEKIFTAKSEMDYIFTQQIVALKETFAKQLLTVKEEIRKENEILRKIDESASTNSPSALPIDILKDYDDALTKTRGELQKFQQISDEVSYHFEREKNELNFEKEAVNQLLTEMKSELEKFREVLNEIKDEIKTFTTFQMAMDSNSRNGNKTAANINEETQSQAPNNRKQDAFWNDLKKSNFVFEAFYFGALLASNAHTIDLICPTTRQGNRNQVQRNSSIHLLHLLSALLSAVYQSLYYWGITFRLAAFTSSALMILLVTHNRPNPLSVVFAILSVLSCGVLFSGFIGAVIISNVFPMVELESRCWILYMVSGPLTVLFVDLAKERPITMLVDCLLVASWQFLFWFVAKFAVLDIIKNFLSHRKNVL